MAAILLGAYTVRIRKKGDNQYLSLNKFNGTDSIFEFLKDFFDMFSKKFTNDRNHQKISSLLQVNHQGKLISGVIETGEYGYTSKLYDIDKGSETYKRKSREAELYPLYFLFDVNTDSTKGILMLEKFGKNGLFTLLKQIIETDFTKKFPLFTMDLNPLVPKWLFEYYMGKGSLKKLTFTTFKIPTDVNKVYQLKGYEEDIKEISISVTAKKNSILPKPRWINDILSGKRKIADLVELRTQFSDVKLDVEMQGSKRTLSINNINRFNPYFDVTDKVKIENGHPVFDSINTEAKQLLDEIEKEILLVN